QATSRTPDDEKVWQHALEATDEGKLIAVRTRGFVPVPMRVRMIKKGEVPADIVPGELLVWTSEDRVQFELTPVGFDEHDGTAVLTEKGQPFVFKSAYNPG